MFDYFGILISVILGLGLTHALRGVARMIQMRHSVKAYWIHVVWTINVVCFVLGIWWGMSWWRNLHEWTTEWFYFLAAYAVIIFMWASMLFPPEISEGMDFEQYFYSNRLWFFGLQTAVCLMDIPETVQKSAAHLRNLPSDYPILISILLATSVTAMVSRRPRVHGVLCLIWAAGTTGYLIFEPLMSRIVGR
jgi:hypothetical protein